MANAVFDLDWRFAVYLAVSFILTVFFLFYFNRLFAALLSYILRWYSWTFYRVRLEINALQISPLAGRVFFTGLRYQGENESIYIQNGLITWRYWLRHVKHNEYSLIPEDSRPGTAETETPGHVKTAESNRPCRLQANLEGAEWIVYNRSPAYNILEEAFIKRHAERAATPKPPGDHGDATKQRSVLKKVRQSFDSNEEGVLSRISTVIFRGRRSESEEDDEKSETSSAGETEDGLTTYDMWLLQILPIEFYCSKGAVVLGNINTPAVLIASCEAARGSLDLGKSKLDKYKQLINVELIEPEIRMNPNPTYVESQVELGKKLERGRLRSVSFSDRETRWKRFHVLFTRQSSFGGSPDQPSAWHGLPRYQSTGADDKNFWEGIEYAANPVLYSGPKMKICFFWDVPRKVSRQDEECLDINGSPAPEWGLHVAIVGGTISYGPWTDRQRVHLQNMFFPRMHLDGRSADRLKPGMDRVSTSFELFIELEDQVTLRVPLREPSKDFKFKKSKFREEKEADRRSGWLDVKVAGNSTIKYEMSFYANKDGFTSSLDIELRKTEMTSSVNQSTLWQSDVDIISCDLSSPLSWNALRTWTFDIYSKQLKLYLLREHIFLLTDLINDWGSGPPSDYYTFTPFVYQLNLKLQDCAIFINCNESNIVNNPASVEENDFLVLRGGLAEGALTIPLNKFMPSQNRITFTVKGEKVYLDHSTPTWNSYSSYSDDKQVAQLRHATINGSYDYWTAAGANLTDTLTIELNGSRGSVTLFGSLVRTFLTLKENYFGSDIRFKTVEEYRESLKSKQPPEPKVDPDRKSNELDVVLSVEGEDVCVYLPSHIYSANECISVKASAISLDLRFTSYYMDLMLNSSPLGVSAGGQDTPQVFVSGLNIYGHRLFGLPPTEPTYMCNWDLDVGRVSGDCTVEFMTLLLKAVKAFDFGLDDDENALADSFEPKVDDVTFLRLSIQDIRVWLRINGAAFLAESQGVALRFNDWARDDLVQSLSATCDIQIACVNEASAARLRDTGRTSDTFAAIKTTIVFAMETRNPEGNPKQVKYIAEQDMRTQRAGFLLPNDQAFDAKSQDEPSQQVPPIVAPFVSTGANGYVDIPKALGSPASKKSAGTDETSIAYDRLRTPTMPPPNFGSMSPASSLTRRRRAASSSIPFSSSFLAPHFPLADAVPSLAEIPAPLSTVAFNLGSKPAVIPEASEFCRTFTLSFTSGIGGFVSPRAFYALSHLLEAIQVRQPTDYLDELQISISGELEHSKRKKSVKPATRAHVVLPQLQLRYLEKISIDSMPLIDRDQADLRISNFAFSMRSASPEAPPDVSTSVSLESFHFSITHPGEDEIVEDVKLEIYDISFVSSSQKALSGSFHLRDAEAMVNSIHLDYLVGLAGRVEKLSNSMQGTFAMVGVTKERRIQELLLRIFAASEAADESDPPFLTTPTYIMGQRGTHLRVHDSWKILSRLRYAYKSTLQRGTKVELHVGDSDYRNQAVSKLEQWASLELKDPANALLVKKVFGPKTLLLEKAVQQDFELLISVGAVGLSVLTTTADNSFALRGLRFSMSKSQPNDSSESDLRDTALAHFELQKAGINLNWELLYVLESLSHLIPSPQPKDTEPHHGHQTLPLIFAKQRIQVLVGIHNASVLLETINSTAELNASEVHGSAVYNELVDNDAVHNAIVSAYVVDLSILNKSSALFTTRLLRSAISVNVRESAEESLDVRCVVGCKKFEIDLTENILVITNVIGSVVTDEVAYLKSLLEIISQEPKPKKPKKKDERSINVTAAIWLDAYSFTFAVLPSLVYIITGDTIQFSSRPLSVNRVDLDIGKQFHQVQIKTEEKWQSISVFSLPTINAKANFSPGEDVTYADTVIALDSVLIEASALHSLFDALNRPEILKVFQDAFHDIKRITKDISRLSKKRRLERPKADSDSTLIFTARVSISEIGIHAQAPVALLDLRFNSIQVFASNSTDRQTVLKYPELEIHLHQILFELARSENGRKEPCGNIELKAQAISSSKPNEHGKLVRTFEVSSDAVIINLFADTASTIVDVIGDLQGRIKDMDFSREVEYLRRLRRAHAQSVIRRASIEHGQLAESTALFGSIYSLTFNNIQISWIVGKMANLYENVEPEDLVLSFKRVELSTKRDNAAKLIIDDFMVEMIPKSSPGSVRAANSALLPQVMFTVVYAGTSNERKFSFLAIGKSVEIQLTPQFVLPASYLQQSLADAASKFRAASASWKSFYARSGLEDKPIITSKKLGSLSIDADFAGAVVHLHSSRSKRDRSGKQSSQQLGLYGQVNSEDPSRSTFLRTPGLAFKIQYTDIDDDRSLNAEIKVDGSENTLYPELVPLLLEISSSVKQIVRESDEKTKKPSAASLTPRTEEDKIVNADPTAILGSTKLNLGFRIARQEFSLSCQPIARVAATARFEYIYMTVNTVKPRDTETFFAVSAVISNLRTSVQHVYSRESTASFELDSVVLSLMNSRHVSDTNGLFAILKLSPMKSQLNVKQLQDFMLFREIWLPKEATQEPSRPLEPLDEQTYLVKRYQQVATASAFPWTASISIEGLQFQADMGQSLGKLSLDLSNFWVTSQKNSDWEQNLSLGLDNIDISCNGRLTGFIGLDRLTARTSIHWPTHGIEMSLSPLIQASVGFRSLRAKVAFDYQSFGVADIASLSFLMYNARDKERGKDRLVGLLTGDKLQIYCTSASAAQALALYQAFERLAEEKREAFATAVRDVERALKRKATSSSAMHKSPKPRSASLKKEQTVRTPGTLHTDVTVFIKEMSIGAFPNTLTDNQIFKILALDTEFRFAVTNVNGRIHSDLSMALGQLRIALSSVSRAPTSGSVTDINIGEVVTASASSRGGTILKVPKLIAKMQTWQYPEANKIEYVFKSTFEGRVDVGWNYTRISFIRGMWETHSRTFSERLGKPLSHPAVVITEAPPDSTSSGTGEHGQGKITAVVNVPLSKYDYVALEPPVIDTPQLRDMGEATPPLEWIGLNRDRLPNVTHQIVIVSLLEVAREVDIAYSRILGTS